MVDNESTPEGGIADSSSQAHTDIHRRTRNPKRLWTAEEDQNIVRMREQGACWRAIADYYSCRRGQVYERYRNYSIFAGVPKKKWTEAEEQELIEQMHIVGKDWILLAELFQCGANTVKNRAYSILRRDAKSYKKKRLECGPYRRAPAVFLKDACYKCGRKH